jgi:succinyl-diaminopimelate desuccinylase
VHGLGASDMKGALAVMIELALAAARRRLALFFGREELPVTRARSRRCSSASRLARRARGDDGADRNAIHAGCLGNINATWTFHGRSGTRRARGRPTTRSTGAARDRRAGAAQPEPHEFDGSRSPRSSRSRGSPAGSPTT